MTVIDHLSPTCDQGIELDRRRCWGWCKYEREAEEGKEGNGCVWENPDKEGEYIVIEFTHFLLFHANTFLRTFVHSSLEFLAGIPTFLGISCIWNFLETKMQQTN